MPKYQTPLDSRGVNHDCAGIDMDAKRDASVMERFQAAEKSPDTMRRAVTSNLNLKKMTA